MCDLDIRKAFMSNDGYLIFANSRNLYNHNKATIKSCTPFDHAPSRRADFSSSIQSWCRRLRIASWEDGRNWRRTTDCFGRFRGAEKHCFRMTKLKRWYLLNASRLYLHCGVHCCPDIVVDITERVWIDRQSFWDLLNILMFLNEKIEEDSRVNNIQA